MHHSIYKKPQIQVFIDEERKYQHQQMQKISHSNIQLNILQQKMKSLLQRDRNKNKSNRNSNKNQEQQKSSQIDRYFQSSKKHIKKSEGEINQNEDMLLDNNNYEQGIKNKQKNRNSSNNILTFRNQLQQKNDRHRNIRQKQASSLKLFVNKKTNEAKNKNTFANNSQTEYNQPLNRQKQHNNQTRSYNIHNQRPTSYTSPLEWQQSSNPNFNPPIITNSTSELSQINRLQQMMLKSVQIKEKQLKLIEEQLQQVQKMKMQQYRRNVERQVLLSNLTQFRNQLPTILENQSQLSSLRPQLKAIGQQLLVQKQSLRSEEQKLTKLLQQLRGEQYQLKLQKKRQHIQLSSLERQFKSILKHRRKRMKQNVQFNHQMTPVIDQEHQQSYLLRRKNTSLKTLKTHKKKSSSNHELGTNGKYTYRNAEHLTMNKKRLRCQPQLSKSKSRGKQSTSVETISGKVYQSASRLATNKNRHAHSNCQLVNKNCGADKILYQMVNQLDKLKDIVNRQIVNTRSTNGRKKVIELYNNIVSNDSQQKFQKIR